MTEEEKHIFKTIEAEHASLRSLVLLLVHWCVRREPAFLDALLSGMSSASNNLFTDEFLSEQGERAQLLSVSYDDLRSALAQLRGHNQEP